MSNFLRCFVLCSAMLLTGYETVFCQESLTPEQLSAYERQTRQMVRFMAYTLNIIGNDSVPNKEKETIINDSYLKIFRDDKVQIEDDLDASRETVTNKDVQSYLKDLDFFFHHVTIAYEISSITHHINHKNELYFLVQCNRVLHAIDLNSDTISNQQLRYIEVNLDDAQQELKIASIYTTRLSEREDLQAWWNRLSTPWREYFGQDIMLGDTLPLRQVIEYNDSLAVIAHEVTITKTNDLFFDSYQLGNDTIQWTVQKTDTLDVTSSQFYAVIKNIWQRHAVNIQGNDKITSLEPLDKLTNLKRLDISHTYIQDLTPIRNLTHLEELTAENTAIETLSAMRFAVNLRNINLANSALSSLAGIEYFPMLERLDIRHNNNLITLDGVEKAPKLHALLMSHTPVETITPLQNNVTLETLDITSTGVKDLQALNNSQSLRRILFDNTAISDITPLQQHKLLREVHMEYTLVDTLAPLSSLASLERVYCDHTNISRREARQFMIEHPGVLVIWESETLQKWWLSLSNPWKSRMARMVSFDEKPGKEHLHQMASLRRIDLSSDSTLKDLHALQIMNNLQSLRIDQTAVKDLSPIATLTELQEIMASHTPIDTLPDMSALQHLERINLSNTPLTEATPLAACPALREIYLDSTRVETIAPLHPLTRLQILSADNGLITRDAAAALLDTLKGCTICYRTGYLNEWWDRLSEPWKNYFMQQTEFRGSPTVLQLHKTEQLREVIITTTDSITDLVALRDLVALEKLIMDGTGIADLSPLSQATHLQQLSCHDNPVTTLQPLAGNNRLQWLDCSNTAITKLDALSGWPLLKHLNISGTAIRNLKPLKNAHHLEWLELYNTRIGSIRPLEGLERLTTIKCYNTRLSQRKINRYQMLHPDCDITFY